MMKKLAAILLAVSILLGVCGAVAETVIATSTDLEISGNVKVSIHIDPVDQLYYGDEIYLHAYVDGVTVSEDRDSEDAPYRLRWERWVAGTKEGEEGQWVTINYGPNLLVTLNAENAGWTYRVVLVTKD